MGSNNNFNQLVNWVEGANLLITEASYNKPTPNHFTVKQIKELSKEGGVVKVLVVHVRPQHEASVKKICQKERKFIFGKNGLKIKI